ncbi:hypothetical protein ACFL6N_07995 [Thermodesulfobacteriota bacterium]
MPNKILLIILCVFLLPSIANAYDTELTFKYPSGSKVTLEYESLNLSPNAEGYAIGCPLFIHGEGNTAKEIGMKWLFMDYEDGDDKKDIFGIGGNYVMRRYLTGAAHNGSYFSLGLDYYFVNYSGDDAFDDHYTMMFSPNLSLGYDLSFPAYRNLIFSLGITGGYSALLDDFAAPGPFISLKLSIGLI